MEDFFRDWDNRRKYERLPYHGNTSKVGHLEWLMSYLISYVDDNVPSSGLLDAPINGDAYSRQNGTWVDVSDKVREAYKLANIVFNSTDFNTYINSGVYAISSITSNINSPLATVSTGTLEVIERKVGLNTFITQVYTHELTNGIRQFIRVRNQASTWSTWKEFSFDANTFILGTPVISSTTSGSILSPSSKNSFTYTGAGAGTYTLPDVVSNAGKEIFIINKSAFILTLQGTIWDFTDVAEKEIASGATESFYSDGVHWASFN